MLCYTCDINDSAFCSFIGEIIWPENGGESHVAVKMLKPDATRETREDFKREVGIMTAFEHDNILRLLGVVTVGMYDYLAWLQSVCTITWRGYSRYVRLLGVVTVGMSIQA